MKTAKRILAMLLAAMMLFGAVSVVNVFAADYSSASTLIATIATTGSLTAKGTAGAAWYKIPATSTATQITFTHSLSASTDLFFTVEVFTATDAANGTNPLARLDIKGNKDTDTVDFTTVPASNYYARVTTNNDSALNVAFTIKYASGAEKGVTETEGNDTPSTANTILIPGKATGKISSSSDKDYYKVTVPESCFLKVSLSHGVAKDVTAKYYIVTIYSDETTRVDSFESLGKDATAALENDPIVSAGVYYISVEFGGSEVSSVEYTLTVSTAEIPDHTDEVENNNAQNEANVIQSGMPMIGALNKTKEGTKDSEDYFKFTLTSNATVSFTFSHTTQNSSSVYYRVKLIDSSNQDIVSTTSKGNESSVSSREYYLGTGTYYFRIFRDTTSGDVDSTISYSLLYIATTISGSETEPNNTYDTADEIILGTVKEPTLYDATISEATDVDYFKFSVKRGYAYINFKSEGNDCQTTYKASIITLSTGSGPVSPIKVKDFDVTYEDGKFSSGCLGLAEGDYYLCVSARYFDTQVQGKYAVGVQYQEYAGYETEENDTPATADPFIKGENSLYITASSFDKNDEDWFKFSVEEGKKYTVKLNCKRLYTNSEITSNTKDSAEYQWTVNVYKEGDYVNQKLSFTFNNREEKNDSVVLGEGVYYVRVKAVPSYRTTKDYKIALTAEEYKDITNPLVWFTQLFNNISSIDWGPFLKSFGWISQINWGDALVRLTNGIISVFKLLATVIGG